MKKQILSVFMAGVCTFSLMTVPVGAKNIPNPVASISSEGQGEDFISFNPNSPRLDSSGNFDFRFSNSVVSDSFTISKSTISFNINSYNDGPGTKQTGFTLTLYKKGAWFAVDTVNFAVGEQMTQSFVGLDTNGVYYFELVSKESPTSTHCKISGSGNITGFKGLA